MVIPLLTRLVRRPRSTDITRQAPIEPATIDVELVDPALASLGEVVVTLRPDALKAFLLAQVDHSDLSEPTRAKLGAELRALDAAAFSGVADRMVEAALLQARAELHLLQARVM